VEDPERVAPDPGGPSRKRRPSPSSGTATNTPAHPRRPQSVAHHRKTVAAQRPDTKGLPCTVRRRRAAWRQAERRPGGRANGAAPPVEAKAWLPPDRQGERQECQRVSAKKAAPSRSGAEKSATLKNPAHSHTLPIVTRMGQDLGLGARSAGKSASLENPAHYQTLPIVTGTAKTLGLVRVSE